MRSGGIADDDAQRPTIASSVVYALELKTIKNLAPYFLGINSLHVKQPNHQTPHSSPLLCTNACLGPLIASFNHSSRGCRPQISIW